MSQQSPPPGLPERPAPALRPDAGEVPTPRSVAPVVTPPAKAKAYVPVVDDDSGGCGRGCVYGLGGAAGCMLLVIGIFAAVFLGLTSAAGQTLDDVFDEFSNFLRIFVPAGSRSYDDIVLPIVDDLELLSELVTTRRNYVDIVTSQTEMPPVLQSLYGDTVVLVVVGSIEAGLDLSEIDAEAIQFNDETDVLTIELPAPRIRACFLDESQTRVVERSTGVFAQPPTDVADFARQFAVQGFTQRAQEDNILGDAEAEAERTMQELLSIILDDDISADITINVEFAAPDPQTTLPDSCQ